jgi:diguanylate cyclase (GGDEF)-like protein
MEETKWLKPSDTSVACRTYGPPATRTYCRHQGYLGLSLADPLFVRSSRDFSARSAAKSIPRFIRKRPVTDGNPSSGVVVPKIAPGDGIAEMQGVLDRHAPGQREAASAATGAAATILIVDDEIQNRKLLEVLLRSEGYLTLSAASGEEALAAIAKRAPDLILLDVVMPGMDGYQVARMLKAGHATASIPIIMVTAQNDRDSRLAGLDAGAEEFLTKPVDRAELWLRVRNLLRLKALGDFFQNHSSILERQVQARNADLQRLGAANESLEHLSLHDGLTNLANRRFFDKYLADQMAIARRYQRPLALVLCDVDSFKAYNDHYGHQAGDECLKQIAAALRICCRRPADMAARYGGDEFAMILPDTGLISAAKIGEAARDAVARLGIPHQHSPVAAHASISGGVAVLFGKVDLTAQQLTAAADQALYQAKHLGRNRMVSAQV